VGVEYEITPKERIDAEGPGDTLQQRVVAEAVPVIDPSLVRRAPKLARFAVTMALLGCLVGMGWAFTLNQEEPQPDGTSLEEVRPPAGSKAVPGQTPVSVDLAYGFDAILSIDGVTIDRSEIVERESDGVFTFTPKETSPYFGRMENGLHSAEVIYWPKTGTREADAEIFQWTFNVV
jgi:hypothetical protein